MNTDTKTIKAEALACIGRDEGIVALMECVSTNFPDLEVYRENEDLVLKHAGKFLIVRRTGADRFRVSENIAVPSTNLVDAGGGAERDLDGLIDDITALAGV